MYDLERLNKIISDIEKYLAELESYNIKNVLNLEDSKTYHASSMLIFAILNRIIDLGTDVLSNEKVGAPSAYQDIMPLLAKANVINKSQANLLNNLVKKRNVFAHFYGEVSKNEVLSTVKEISLVKSFVISLKKRIKSKSN